ncbi:hypothetical protein V8E36_008199 [Tilletia maclaganii]
MGPPYTHTLALEPAPGTDVAATKTHRSHTLDSGHVSSPAGCPTPAMSHLSSSDGAALKEFRPPNLAGTARHSAEAFNPLLARSASSRHPSGDASSRSLPRRGSRSHLPQHIQLLAALPLPPVPVRTNASDSFTGKHGVESHHTQAGTARPLPSDHSIDPDSHGAEMDDKTPYASPPSVVIDGLPCDDNFQAALQMLKHEISVSTAGHIQHRYISCTPQALTSFLPELSCDTPYTNSLHGHEQSDGVDEAMVALSEALGLSDTSLTHNRSNASLHKHPSHEIAGSPYRRGDGSSSLSLGYRDQSLSAKSLDTEANPGEAGAPAPAADMRPSASHGYRSTTSPGNQHVEALRSAGRHRIRPCRSSLDFGAAAGVTGSGGAASNSNDPTPPTPPTPTGTLRLRRSRSFIISVQSTELAEQGIHGEDRAAVVSAASTSDVGQRSESASSNTSSGRARHEKRFLKTAEAILQRAHLHWPHVHPHSADSTHPSNSHHEEHRESGSKHSKFHWPHPHLPHLHWPHFHHHSSASDALADGHGDHHKGHHSAIKTTQGSVHTSDPGSKHSKFHWPHPHLPHLHWPHFHHHSSSSDAIADGHDDHHKGRHPSIKTAQGSLHSSDPGNKHSKFHWPHPHMPHLHWPHFHHHSSSPSDAIAEGHDDDHEHHHSSKKALKAHIHKPHSSSHHHDHHGSDTSTTASGKQQQQHEHDDKHAATKPSRLDRAHIPHPHSNFHRPHRSTPSSEASSVLGERASLHAATL